MTFTKVVEKQWAKLYTLQAGIIIALFYVLSDHFAYRQTSQFFKRLKLTPKSNLTQKSDGTPTDLGKIIHGSVLVLLTAPAMALATMIIDKLDFSKKSS